MARKEKQCPHCKEMIHAEATKCPYCHEKQPLPPLAMLIAILIVLVGVAMLWTTCCGSFLNPSTPRATDVPTQRTPNYEAALRDEMSYLNEIREVATFEIEDNNVYIGFDPVPDDWDNIIRSTAMNGHRTIDSECRVWAYQGGERWRPGDGPHLGNVTARNGSIVE